MPAVDLSNIDWSQDAADLIDEVAERVFDLYPEKGAEWARARADRLVIERLKRSA